MTLVQSDLAGLLEAIRCGGDNEWLIERLGHRTPREAFNEATALVAA